MENPFIFIESKITNRDEFEITEGRQPTCALLYLKEGSFSLRFGKESTIIQSGDCAVFSDDIDFFRSVIQPISFIFIKFRPNPRCPFAPVIPFGRVEFRNKARFDDSIRLYESLMNIQTPWIVHYREHLLTDILWQISAENADRSAVPGDGPAAPPRDDVVRNAVDWIDTNLDKKISIHRLCREVSSNPTTLNFKFRREFDMSVGQYIAQQRMALATLLLTNTTFSIGEIARRCGYENIYYFSAAFRKNSGLSPTDFRKQYR